MHAVALDALVAAIESRLDALAGAMQQRDAQAIETHAQELQRALAAALTRLSHDPERAAVPRELQQRIARAGARVAQQREQVARASGGVERELTVLVPAAAPGAVYGQGGQTARTARGGFAAA